MVEFKPENILNKLRQTINNGKYGRDYTVIARDKNNLIREKYFLDDAKIKTILLELTADDYVASEPSDNDEFPNDIVHKFIREVKLLKRYSEDLVPESVKLYIKFTWSASLNGKMIIISFHEENDI